MKNEPNKRDPEVVMHTVGRYAVIGYATLHLVLTLGENLVTTVVHLVK